MKPFACLFAATLAAVTAAAPPAPARAQPASGDARASADAHRAAGDAHYEAGNLAAAMAAYQAAYKLDPRGEFLFSMARIESDRGDCAASIALYRRFLAGGPGPNSTRAAEEAIATCEQKLAASGAGATADPEPPAPTTPEPSRPPPEPQPVPLPATRSVTRPFYTDVVGDLLVGAGVAGLATGGAFYLLARRDVAEAERGGAGGVSLPEYEALADRADRRQRYAAIAGGVGAALIAGGIVRYLTSDRTETVRVSPAVGAGGASVTLDLRF